MRSSKRIRSRPNKKSLKKRVYKKRISRKGVNKKRSINKRITKKKGLVRKKVSKKKMKGGTKKFSFFKKRNRNNNNETKREEPRYERKESRYERFKRLDTKVTYKNEKYYLNPGPGRRAEDYLDPDPGQEPQRFLYSFIEEYFGDDMENLKVNKTDQHEKLEKELQDFIEDCINSERTNESKYVIYYQDGCCEEIYLFVFNYKKQNIENTDDLQENKEDINKHFFIQIYPKFGFNFKEYSGIGTDQESIIRNFSDHPERFGKYFNKVKLITEEQYNSIIDKAEKLKNEYKKLRLEIDSGLKADWISKWRNNTGVRYR